ncbi:MAG: helix-turn-helix domain-containing protein [Maritimibacter sp.]|nr:helix-turn-helix domain-containing protein [Maritimibacter sp.]
MLTVEDVATHFGLRPETIRRKARRGEIQGIRVRRLYRFGWLDVWACEDGPMPKGARQERYKQQLLSRQKIASALGVSTRTVDRWIDEGLPTRNAFGAVRLNPDDATDWLQLALGATLPAKWWQ